MSRRSDPYLAGVLRRRPNGPQFRALLGELELGKLELGELEFSDLELSFEICKLRSSNLKRKLALFSLLI